MTGYRFNSKKREDRIFNNCEVEKNPNQIKFYASNLDYANNYKFVYNEDGEFWYECALEVVEIENVNLFDMANDFKTLTTYKNYFSKIINKQLNDYTKFLNEATTKTKKAMWENAIKNLENREDELIYNLEINEFQPLSDFATQNELVAELKALGFQGYATKNEIAIL